MEAFLNIPWVKGQQAGNQSTSFLSDAYFNKHSYLMQDVYDAWKDSSDDDEDAVVRRKSIADNEMNEPKKKRGKEKKKKTAKEHIYRTNLNAPNMHVPCKSQLSAKEQALYLELMQKLTKEKLPYLDEEGKRQLCTFQDLQARVEEEQKEYIEFVRKKAEENPIAYDKILVSCRRYIEDLMKAQINLILERPMASKYKCLAPHPLVPPDGSKPVEMVALRQDLLCIGTVSKFKEISFDCKVKVPESRAMMNKQFPLPVDLDASSLVYKIPVSMDLNAQNLAVTHRADIVVSGSTLQHLVDNHAPNYARQWLVPVFIKEHEVANKSQKFSVVYLDKALPPKNISNIQKKTWFFKKAIRAVMCDKTSTGHSYSASKQSEARKTANSKSKENNETEKQKSSASMEESPPTSSIQKNNSEYPNFPSSEELAQDLLLSSSEEDRPLSHLVEKEKQSNSRFPLDTAPGHNYVYNLWSLRHKEGNKKELRVLVRSSHHAHERNEKNNVLEMIRLSIKLEHQPMFGAQQMTLSELTREWMSLHLRPNTSLMRARINAETREVIQVQHRNRREVVAEGHKMGLSPSSCLASIHHLLFKLRELSPSEYMLRHLAGTHVEILKADPRASGPRIYNLIQDYEDVDTKESLPTQVVYQPIDPSIITPYHRKYGQVPAIFLPFNETSEQFYPFKL